MDKISWPQKVLAIAISLCSSTSMAGTMGEIYPVNNWIISLSGAAAWASAGKTQTFFLTPEIEKNYFATKSSQTISQGELFLGVQKAYSELSLQLGLAFASTANVHLAGQIWDDANPAFNNHTYRYKIRHSHVAIKAKLIPNESTFIFSPYLSASIGAGFNQAHDFTNAPTIFEAIENPNFSSKTITSFTYTLGAGIQKNVNKHLQIGLGYEFADWGKSQLGLAQGQTLNRGLTLNHLYTNAIVASLSYLI